MDERDIILFDGVCNLCNGAVRFIIKRDRKAQFKFTSLQSAFAQKELVRLGLDPALMHSIILLQAGHYLQRSDAVLAIAEKLDGPWPFLSSVARIIPRFIREGMYKLIAGNRYRLFGKKDTCMIPTEDLRARFIG